MPALTTSELNLLRSDNHRAIFYLSINQPRTLLAATVSGSPARGAQSISYSGGAGAGFGDIEAGHVLKVVTSAGTFRVRVQSVSGTASSGTVTVDKNSILWASGQSFVILEDYPLFPLPPRFDSSGNFYKNWTTTYAASGNANSQPDPVCITGGHRVGKLVNGSLEFAIDLSDSYAVANGATISSYSLSVTPSTGASVSFNTATGLGTVTITTAGQYWLKSSVTDSNGKTQQRRDRLFAHDSDPDSGDYPYTDFTVETLNGDYERGGWLLNVTVNGEADTDVFPDEALVVLWCEAFYDGAPAQIGGVSDKNILFAGYITRDSVTANWEHSQVSFQAETIDGLLRTIQMRLITLQAVASPADWYQYANWLTCGRGIHHLWWQHSTLMTICDVFDLTANTLGRAFADFEKGNLYSMADTFIRQYGVMAHICAGKAGQIRIEQDLQFLSDSDRAAALVVAEITEADRRGDVTIVEQRKQAAEVQVEGLAFDGLNITALCAEAPGDTQEIDGVEVVSVFRQVLENQAHANSLAGRALAAANNPTPEARVAFHGLYIGALEVARQEFWQMTLDAADTNRGIIWSSKNLILRQVTSQIDTINGMVVSDAVFEPEADGPIGVETDCITGIPTAEPPAPPWDAGLDALVASSGDASGVYYRDENDTDWDTLSSDATAHVAVDPFWRTRQETSDPSQAILWRCETGKIERSTDGGQTWQDRTPISDPPNTWSDATAPTVADLEFFQILPSRHAQSRFLFLARWQNASSEWRGWLLETENDGRGHTWVELYNGSSLPDEIQPIWAATNGTYTLVTAWVDDGGGFLRLLAFDSDLAFSAQHALGSASLVEITERIKYAIPVAVIDDDSLWHVAGRMDAPAGLVGTQHVIKTTDAGGGWTSFESGLAGEHVQALHVDSDSGGSRDYYAAVSDLAVTFGAETELANGNTNDIVVLPWSGDTVIFIFNETTTGARNPKVGLSDCSGSTVGALTKKTNIFSDGNNWDYIDADILIAGSKLCVTGNRGISGGLGYAIVASEDTSDFSFDTGVTLGVGVIVETACAAFSSTHFLAVADDHLVLLSVSGDTPTVEDNASTLSGTPKFVSAAKLTSSKAVVVYADTADGDKLKAQIVNRSGSAITSVGSQQTLDAVAYTAASQLSHASQKRTKRIDDTTFITAYRDGTNGRLYAVVCTVSGNTITPGTPVDLGSLDTDHGGPAVDVSGSKALFAFAIDSGSDPGQAKTAALDGTTIYDNGNDGEFDDGSGSINGTSALILEAGKGVVAWAQGGTSGTKPHAKIANWET